MLQNLTTPVPALKVCITPISGRVPFSDAVRAVRVDVLAHDKPNNRAMIEFRQGKNTVRETVALSDLAFSSASAAKKSEALFAALLSRPLLQPVAGKTESNAAANSPAEQTANSAKETTPVSP